MVDGGFILRALIHDLMLSKHRERGRFISKGGLNCEFIYSIRPPGRVQSVLDVGASGTELTVNLFALVGCDQTKYWLLRVK